MATANELFAANGEDYIVIDSDLRTMTFPASVNNIGVENDKDVHKLNFKMPRYFSGYDLSKFIIHINYVNANGDGDMYYVLDPTVEENEIKFSWLVGRHACLYRGSVTFIVCLKLADGEGDVAQEFNTTLASLQVLPGLETEPTILETEHDIIEQLLLSINDTNAKIKAVLDTGLTPEQIAEFYNKSKNYDTQITANANAITTLNSKLWKRIASIESVDSLVQILVPAGTPSNMLAGFIWLQDRDKIILPMLGWFKGYYTFQNAYGSPYDAGGYIYLTDGNGKPYGEIYITGISSTGFTAVLNNKLVTREEVDALNSRSYQQISTNYASGCYTYKRGNVGFLKISDPKNLEANTTTVIGNLPAGFRPDVVHSFYLSIRNMASGIGVTINPNGDINVYNYSSNTGTLNINETITYPLV